MECGNESLIAAGREAVAKAWPEVTRELARRSQQRASR
jgi:hypothetical protein